MHVFRSTIVSRDLPTLPNICCFPCESNNTSLPHTVGIKTGEIADLLSDHCEPDDLTWFHDSHYGDATLQACKTRTRRLA
jgi:hypothetical protein